jgi:hypothetical protein
MSRATRGKSFIYATRKGQNASLDQIVFHILGSPDESEMQSVEPFKRLTSASSANLKA